MAWIAISKSFGVSQRIGEGEEVLMGQDESYLSHADSVVLSLVSCFLCYTEL